VLFVHKSDVEIRHGAEGVVSGTDSPELHFQFGVLRLPAAFDQDMRDAIRLATIDEAALQPFHAERERDFVRVGWPGLAAILPPARTAAPPRRLIVASARVAPYGLKCFDSFRLCAW
jgi:hypothetical protein